MIYGARSAGGILRTGLALVALLAGMLTPARTAQSRAVDCSTGGSISAALSTLRPGETLLVTGTCRESVTIPPSLNGITLDAAGKAVLTVAETAPIVVNVFSRETTVRGFTIRGGRNGVLVARGAAAYIDGNTIEDTGSGGQPGSGLGINVAQHSFAVIRNNTIQNNRSISILVHENSSARIGFGDIALTGAGGANLIQHNGDGIFVSRAASARIFGSRIIDNQKNGVLVERGSHAEIAGNVIEGNAGNGIEITRGSGVDLEIAATVTMPNNTSADKKNGGYGLRCSLGGYVAGPLGTLNGVKGAKNIDRTCVDALTP